MPVVLVANPKGGAGKSTLATQVAGYFASRGHAVMLGDIDRQQSSALWLRLRPAAAAPISGWAVDAEHVARLPKGVTHAVLDSPAGLHGKRLSEALKRADRVLVPVQPSLFDLYATQAFLDELSDHRRATGLAIGLVGMRVDERTLAARQLEQFVQRLDLPVLAFLRPTQNYVQLAARGLSLFDLDPARVAKDLEQWQGICRWLDAGMPSA